MVKQSELEIMVCDLFVDVFRAGASGGDNAFATARGSRARLIDKIGELYAELEQESYHREEFVVELHNANMEIYRLKHERDHLHGQVVSQQETIRKQCDEIRRLNKQLDFQADSENYMESFEEVPDHHDAFDTMFPGCTPDDLPFPDIEPLADADEVLGGDE